jgi:iron complex outermembrane receptor protein
MSLSKKVCNTPIFFASVLAIVLPFSKTSLALETANQYAISPNSSSLLEATEQLERIEITGQISTGLMESEISIADTSSPDLRKQLSQIPGVNVNGNGLISGVMQYRGLFGDRLSLKIDNMQIAGAGPNAMDSPLSHVMGNSHQVILHQGIAPVSVGYETLAGAIEIKDAAPIFSANGEWQTSGRVSGGLYSNNEASNASVRVNMANKQSYVSLLGQFQDADNYESGNGTTVPSTFYERSGGKISAGHHTSDSRLDAVIGIVNTNESGTPALSMDINFVDSIWYNLQYAKDINPSWQVKVKVLGNQNDHIMNNVDLRTSPAMSSMYRENEVSSTAAGMDIDLVRSKTNNNTLTFGLNTYEQRHNSRITNPSNAMFFIQNFNKVKRRVDSIYAQYDFIVDEENKSAIQAMEAVKWQLGARATNVSFDARNVGSNMTMGNPNVAALVDRFNNAERNIDYSLADIVLKAHTPLSDNMQGTFSIGQKERAPSYSEVYSWFPLGVSAGLADGRNYIGNLNLKKESAKQTDIGLQYQHNGLSIIGNLFYQSIDDYIVGVPTTDMPSNMIANMMGAQSPLQWNNTKATLYGSDVYISKVVNNQWQVTASAEWVKGTLDDPLSGETLSLYRVAPFSVHAAIHYSQDKLDMSLGLEAAARQNDVSTLQNESPTAGYAVWNVIANYQFSNALRASLIVENLLDKEYATHLGGVNRIQASDVPLGAKVPETGRNIGVYLDYSF